VSSTQAADGPGATQGSAAMVVHFSPTIQVNAGGDLRGQVQQALRMSFTEFEALMRQYKERVGRRAYGEIA